MFACDELIRTVTLIHYHKTKHVQQIGKVWSATETESVTLNYHTARLKGVNDCSLDIQISDFMKYDEAMTMYRETKIISIIDKSMDIV